MLFVTNRHFVEGAKSQAGRMLGFDLVNNEPGASVFFCERHDANIYQEVTSTPFFGRLKRSPRRQVLFYLHGYNTMPEDAFEIAHRLQDGLDKLDPLAAEVVPVIWPCDSDLGLIKDYWDDQVAAEQSAVAFARALDRFVAWRNQQAGDAVPCLKHMNLLAHSMGNRVAAYTIKRWVADQGAQALFRNLFLMAADIPNHALQSGEIGDALPEVTRNLLVYYAADDFALRTSKAANLRNRVLSRRLGHTGPEHIERTARNVFAIDCGEFNNDFDKLGHTYFLTGSDGEPGPVLRHMAEVMRRGRVRTPKAGSRDWCLVEADQRQALAHAGEQLLVS